MTFRFLAVILSVVLLAAPAPAAEEVLDGIAAVVNGDVITFSQVRELIAAREQTLRQTYKGQEMMDKVKDLRLSAINDLIDRQLVLQEFKKNKFSIPDYLIDDHINTIVREQFNNDRQAFIRTLQAQGYSIQRFRKMETDRMIVQAMRERAVKSSQILSPAKLEQYYNRHRSEFAVADQVKLRMIVLRSDNPDAKNVAAELRTKIAGGADFAKMAEMYSEDSSKATGGDWGWIERSTLNENLSKPAFALKPGQLSKVIEANGSYYILYAEARKNGGVKPLEAVREDISKKVLQEDRQQAQQKWIESLRKKAYVKIY